MSQFLSDLRNLAPTGLPAVLLLVLWPVFLLLPGRYVRQFYVLSGVLLLSMIDGPWVGGGIFVAAVVGYFLVEWLARHHAGNAAWFWGTWIGLHGAFFVCYELPTPAWYQGIREVDRSAVFILFSGVGLTFFRLLSYFIDRVRRGEDGVSLLDFLSFMLFFPQARRGPIERCQPFAAELAQSRTDWRWRDAAIGFGRLAAVLVGLKIVLDTFSKVHQWGGAWLEQALPKLGGFERLEAICAHPEQLSAGQFFIFLLMPMLALWLVEAMFTHIQLGVGRVFGVVGTENYNQWYLAESPRLIWQRWNITLSQWLQRNVFALFNGRRQPMLATLVTFVYCGALHTPTQLRGYVWGLWCALWMIGLIQWRKIHKPKRGPITGWGQVRIFVQRLLTIVWGNITVVILIDYEYCGMRILWRYLQIVTWPVRALW